MSQLSRFVLDLSEEFPNLEHAPIIEAVIHWQAHANKDLNPPTLKDEIIRRLPEYPICQPQHDIQISASGTPDGISQQLVQQTQWIGFRLQDKQNHYVAQFTQAGVVFSCLKPYENWDSFQAEAMRFWQVFLELAAPTTIQQLGVRFINRIPLLHNESPATYLKTAQSPLVELELPTESFFYRDTHQFPGYPYRVNWVRTIQPQSSTTSGERALIVDIDVFTPELIYLEREPLSQRLH